MALSGVRSSWLMLDRKSDFARLAAFGRHGSRFAQLLPVHPLLRAVLSVPISR
jgi:hypothetical protein